MDLASIAISTAGVLGAIGVILIALKKVGQFVRRMVHVVDIIVGTPGDDGLPGTPGIATRLQAIEYELKPNSGKSMKDQVSRLEEWTVAHSLIHKDLQGHHN